MNYIALSLYLNEVSQRGYTYYFIGEASSIAHCSTVLQTANKLFRCLFSCRDRYYLLVCLLSVYE